MKTNNKNLRTNRKKRFITIVIVTIAVLALATASYALLITNNPNQDGDTTNNTGAPSGNNDSTDKTDTNQNPSDLPAKNPEETGNENLDELDSLSESKEIEVAEVIRFNQSSNDQSLRIVANLEKNSNGKCLFSLSSDADSIRREVAVVVAPSSFSCSTSIDRSLIPKPGTWTLITYHIVGDKYSQTTKSTLEVK